MGASGASLRVNGVGAVLGPIAAGAVVAATAPTMFFWCMVVTHGLIAAYATIRVVADDALPAGLSRPLVRSR
jgi:hypothetical protein